MPIDSIAVATVIVKDQEKAKAFYTDVLGFEVRADMPFAGDQRWLTVSPKGESTELAIQPESEMGRAGGMSGVCFGAKDIQATAAELKSRGVIFTQEPAVQEWGGTMGLFSDPDGNIFVLHDQEG